MGCANGVAVSAEYLDVAEEVCKATSFEQEYSVGEIIGTGAFGKVYAASQRSTGKECAVKLTELVDKKLSQERQIEQAFVMRKKAKMEVDVWQAVGKHPNIVEFRGWFIEQSHNFLVVMERCSCTASEKLSSGSLCDTKSIVWLLREMLLGVQACHRVSVVHRDIKLDNFLISADGFNVKLCDFGLAAKLKRDAGVDFLEGEIGTPPLMSPEMVHGMAYNTSTDVWSFGATVYLILFGELPYIPKEITAKAAKEAVRVGQPKPRFLDAGLNQHSETAVNFVHNLLERDPANRVTAMTALGHPYLQEQLKPISEQMDSMSTLSHLEGGADGFSSSGSPANNDVSPAHSSTTLTTIY